jgi:exonuclease SbcC
MINRVRLKNWRSHADSEFIFSPGTNALVGILGSGKTSVLDSISFAFFGTFPALQMRKLKIDDLIMKKPERKDRSEVEVEFELDGSKYLARRIIDRGKGTTYSEIKKDGKILESPNAQRVTEAIEKILKVDYDLFSKAIYAEQNNLDYFLKLGKGERMKRIDELLMIEKFEKARSAAVTLTNKIADRIVGKESVIERTDSESVKNALDEAKSSLQNLMDMKRGLEVEITGVKNRKVELEREVGGLKSIHENFQSLKRQESGMNSAIEETDKIISGLKSVLEGIDMADLPSMLDTLSTRLQELDGTMERKLMEYQELGKKFAESKSKIEFLRNEKIEKLEREVEEKLRLKVEFERLQNQTGENVDEQIVEKDGMYNGIISELADMKAKIKGLKDVLDTLSSVEGKCPVCESSLSDERRRLLIEKKDYELDELSKNVMEVEERKQLTELEIAKIKSAADKMKELLMEIRDFEDIRVELENSKNLFRECGNSASALDSQLHGVKREIEDMRSELEKMRNDRQQAQLLQSKMKDYREREGRLKELIENREELKLRLRLEEGKIKEGELEKLEGWLKNAILKEKEIEMRIDGIDNLAGEKQARVKEYEAAVQQMEKDKAEVERLRKNVKELKIFTEALRQTQVQLRENFISAVNMRMAELWQTLYPYRDFAGVALAIEEGDYVLKLQERSGAWVNVEGVASGGERSIACLALRIAFSFVLTPQLPMLVLYEPTANLDSKAVEDLARTLREGMTNFVDQIFLITHDEKLEEAVTGSLYRLERDKSKDGFTRVSAI